MLWGNLGLSKVLVCLPATVPFWSARCEGHRRSSDCSEAYRSAGRTTAVEEQRKATASGRAKVGGLNLRIKITTTSSLPAAHPQAAALILPPSSTSFARRWQNENAKRPENTVTIYEHRVGESVKRFVAHPLCRSVRRTSTPRAAQARPVRPTCAHAHAVLIDTESVRRRDWVAFPLT